MDASRVGSLVAYLGITALEGQLITPTLIGHRLTINPFLVFLSIACWSWMWGPVGAFLGVPILLRAMVAVRRLSSTGSGNAALHVTAASLRKRPKTPSGLATDSDVALGKPVAETLAPRRKLLSQFRFCCNGSRDADGARECSFPRRSCSSRL